MRALHVQLRDPSGRLHRVGPGGLIGRAPTAACWLEDPRVSEAHAMVSLRGRELRLLSLRGIVRVDGVEEDDVALAVGQTIALAPGVELQVVAVELPTHVLALRIGAGRPRELRAAVYSLVAPGRGRPAELVPRYVEGAAARVWSTTEGWSIQTAGGASRPIKPGRSWRVGALQLHALELTLAEVSAATTRDRDDRYAPLRVVTRYTTVHIHRAGRVPAIINGKPARLLAELADFGCPTPWETVAREIWPDGANAVLLRKRWDRVLGRLRESLREHGIRDDLVQTDRRGNAELMLQPRDRVIDEG